METEQYTNLERVYGQEERRLRIQSAAVLAEMLKSPLISQSDGAFLFQLAIEYLTTDTQIDKNYASMLMQQKSKEFSMPNRPAGMRGQR